MRMGSSEIQFQGHRGRTRAQLRASKLRKGRTLLTDLEGLEARTLLATIPAAAIATVDGTPEPPVSLTPFVEATTTADGNANSPTVMLNPYNSQDVVAVWTVDISNLSPTPQTTSILEGAYSSDGGTTWSELDGLGGVFFDPNTSNPVVPYAQVTDPSLGFDNANDFYVLSSQHNAANSSGSVVLDKFTFSGSGSVVQDSIGSDGNDTNVIYQWLPTSDYAYSPTIAVDSGSVPSTVTTPPAGVLADPFVGNVYVAWATQDIAPADPFEYVPFNPDRIFLESSQDGGLTFSNSVTVNENGNFGPEKDAHPQLVINHNNTATNGGSNIGQVTVAWENFGSLATASPPSSILESATVDPGVSTVETGVSPGEEVPVGPSSIIGVPVTVNVPDPTDINTLTATVAIDEQSSLANLAVELVAPDGEAFLLFTNQNDAAGAVISPGIGITGSALGIQGFVTGAAGVGSGDVIGTTFTDNATRDIVDINPVTGARGAAAPFIGDFQAEANLEGETLNEFVKGVEAANPVTGVNGEWELVVENVSPTVPAAGTNAADVREFKLNFTAGLSVGAESIIAAPGFYAYDSSGDTLPAIVVPGALGNNYPTNIPSSPNGAGPGLVLAEDNTLGSFSPYQGRIYAAFVGYFNVTDPQNFTNPTTNTDIFLSYYDPSTKIWSTPTLVNDDVAVDDGYSSEQIANIGSQNQPDGRTQFQPAIAVDQATGTVVLSWRDARDDAANARVATYITASIDGGNTFNPQTYANPSDTAVDAITGATNVISPDADNQSGGNAQRDTNFGYGSQMGLAVFDGQVYPVWAGNFTFSDGEFEPGGQTTPGSYLDSFYNASTGTVMGYALNIWYQPMVIASGPRITSSTMGPVVDTTLTGAASDLTLFIPPVGTSKPQTSTIEITGDPSLLVSSLSVTVNVIYPTDGNLTLTLIAPDGTSVVLYQNPSDTGQNFTETTFSDSASQSILSGTAPYTGTYQPLNSLSTFDNHSTFGDWKLEISGGIGPHGGLLQGWSLSINAVAPKPTSFEVTFDRPVDPQSLIDLGDATFTTGDVQVFYQGTTNGSPSIPLLVTSVTPITDSGVSNRNGNIGYTQFLVDFNPDEEPDGSSSGLATSSYTGTYSYVVLPDDGNGNIISAPIASYRETPIPLPQPISATASPNLPIPKWGPGGSGNLNEDETVSTLKVSGFQGYTITNLSVNLNIQNTVDGSLFIELMAPNGEVAVLYYKPGDTSSNFTNVTFSDTGAQSILVANGPYDNGTYQPYTSLSTLAGQAVDGTYTLIIDNYQYTNSGTLLSWSLNVSASKLALEYHTGAGMDQNADGTSDQNPLTLPYTGLTPGDAYAAPMPAPVSPITFNSVQSILSAPFNQNTLPLIMPGPYVVSTSAPNGTGSDNLVLNGTNSSLDVTFDRPIQTSTFIPDQILQIMGPVGAISGPQAFPSDSEGLTIPAATTAGPGVLTSTLTIPSYDGTFDIANIALGLNAVFQPDSSLSAEVIAPNGDTVMLFQSVGGNGADFVNTVFSDSAETPIAKGTAPFTGTYQPAQSLNAAFDNLPVDIQNAEGQWVAGVWQLKIFNSSPNAVGTLESWSLNITPKLTITPVNPSMVTINGKQVQVATTFTIGFPQQELSGTYTFQIGQSPSTGIFPEDAAGEQVDSSYSAGLDILRGGSSTDPVTTAAYSADDLPKVVANPVGTTSSTVTSTIVVPDNFIVQGDTTSSGVSGVRVTLNLDYPTDADLTIELQHLGLNGQILGTVPLASNVGGGATTANFSNTVFDDNASTPIQAAGAPFFGTYNPQMPLAAFAGMNAQGSWVLVVTDSGQTGGSGEINGWSISFQKPLPTSGLGEPGADNISASFRIFTLGQADALSAEAWTPVGAASISAGSGAASPISTTSSSAESANDGRSGRVTGVAADPSDPTGNTVYAAGASGGVWKTTDFLTTNPAGPTWIPLTNFGPTNAVNIGNITVFPVNDNVSQSIIIAATGEGNTGTPGVGFLISTNGGATWTLDDSSVNVDSSGNPLPIETTNPALERNRTFVGDTAYQVVVDPKLSPSGGVIIYAAMSGPTGGIWRSENTGETWTNLLPGQATSVVLDADSAEVLNPDTDPAAQGNLQIVYAGLTTTGAGSGGGAGGVYMSTNQGGSWIPMNGGVGNPLIVNDDSPGGQANVNPAAGPTPNNVDNSGRIALSVPAPTGNAVEDAQYAGWLYAVTVNAGGVTTGLFVTKDFGANWTQIRIPTLPSLGQVAQAVPTNDINQPNYPITGGGGTLGAQGTYDLILITDPTNPNVIYVGGTADGGQTALIRVDTTNLWDAHSLVPYSDFLSDGGALNLSSTGPAVVGALKGAPPFYTNPYEYYETGDPEDYTAYENFLRNPQSPFLTNSAQYVWDYSSFTNNGAGATWTPFDAGGTDYHAVTVMIDPLTGLPRIILGNDQGVWTILDNNGTFETQVGQSSDGVEQGSPTAQLSPTDRNGNLQITQFYYGAVQPSTAAAEIAGAMFYGSAQDDGGPVSSPNILTTGDLTWNGPGGDAAGVGTDQQGLGTAYQYFWPCCGGDDTNFFQYIGPGTSGSGLSFTGNISGNYVGRTNGLLQSSNNLPTPDSQWPYKGGANFAVNPVNGNDVVISSATGAIFTTSDQGVQWFEVGSAADFGSPGSFSVALAYGAPDPNAPAGIGNLGNFIYVGTETGEVYVTQDGGGSGIISGTNSNWTEISTGLTGSIKSITTDPTRGSHDAYAVTTTGVFYIANSIESSTNPTPTWVNITGDLADSIKNQTYSIFGQTYDPLTDGNSVTYNQVSTLSSIVADWRYMIPNNPSNLSAGYHPVLYVGGNSGVYQSLDNGATWSLFPNTTYGAVAQGGDLPHVSVTDLNLALGDVSVNTGEPTLAGPYQTFVFSGTLSTGSATVTGITNLSLLAPGDDIAGPGIPAGTTILSISSTEPNTITLSANAMATGAQTLAADNPTTAADPDILAATTYGEGQFAINLAPLLLGNTVSVSPTFANSTSGAPPVVTGPITIGGSSEISAFGNTTWITVEDVTNPADPQVIAGFNPADGVAVPGASNSTNALGNFSIPFDPASYFTSNGTKTIEVFATDNAGSVGNIVTYTFTLNDSNLPAPPPTNTPTVSIQVAPSSVKTTTTGTLAFTGSVTNGSTALNNLSSTAGLSIGLAVSATAPGIIPTGTTIAAITPTNFVGSATSGSDLVTAISSTTGLAIGETVTGLGIPNGTTITAIDAGTSTVTLSMDATVTKTLTLTAVSVTLSNPATFTGTATFNSPIASVAVTSQTTPEIDGTVTAGATALVYEYEYDATTGLYDTLYAIVTPTVANNGTFTIAFANPQSLASGLFEIEATGFYSQFPLLGSSLSPAIFLDIDNTTPVAASGVSLAPTSDTGIIGDDITSDRSPVFTGTATPGDTVQLLVQGSPTVYATATVNASGTFNVQLPYALSDGDITVQVNVIDPGSGNSSGLSAPLTVDIVSVASDYAGAYTTPAPANQAVSYSDPAVFSPNTTTGKGQWLIEAPNGTTPPAFWTPSGTPFGPASSVIPFQGDFNGDGLTDLAYYSQATATWYFDSSKQGVVSSFKLGTPNVSVPVVGYFDPNLAEEAAVYTVVNGLGTWTINSASTGVRTVQFGQAGDIPVPGDYTGVGYDELAVYRPSTGQFLVQVPGTATPLSIPLPAGTPDLSSLVPVPGNYDPYLDKAVTPNVWVENTEAAWYDPTTGTFTIQGPSVAYTVSGFQPNDIPVPADYAGNGSTQPAVFRPSTGQVFAEEGGTVTLIATFATPATNDIPLAAPLSYRMALVSASTGGGTGGTGTTGGLGTGTTGSGSTGSTGSGGSTGTGSIGTTGGSTGGGTGSGSTGGITTGTGTGTVGSSSSGNTSSISPPAQSPSTGTSTTGGHKVIHKKAVSHPKPSSHTKKSSKPAAKKTTTASKPKAHVHVSSHASHNVVSQAAVATASQKKAHVIDLALQDIHVNSLRSSSKKYHV